ncbi:MAG: hypothetical protein BWK76_17800 [Desulfobulbaceae bacterium A2]|nr:MAG: hypothetical protein BWK76_17800 [Desulfobulbaceae bacterium A2]
MKKNVLVTVLVLFGLTMFFGCASMHTWPDYERSAEHKMIAIQEQIGDGLKTGVLSPDQSQMFLSTLKGIRIDYSALRDKVVPQENWTILHQRLDTLGSEINRALTRNARIEEPVNGDKIATLQRIIDDARITRRLTLTEEREFQARLDSIRREYLRMMEGDRRVTYEERADIAQRLDFLASDLKRFR